MSVTFLEEVQVGWLGLAMTFACFPQQAPHCETFVHLCSGNVLNVGIQEGGNRYLAVNVRYFLPIFGGGTEYWVSSSLEAEKSLTLS